MILLVHFRTFPFLLLLPLLFTGSPFLILSLTYFSFSLDSLVIFCTAHRRCEAYANTAIIWKYRHKRFLFIVIVFDVWRWKPVCTDGTTAAAHQPHCLRYQRALGCVSRSDQEETNASRRSHTSQPRGSSAKTDINHLRCGFCTEPNTRAAPRCAGP